MNILALKKPITKKKKEKSHMLQLKKKKILHAKLKDPTRHN